MKIILVPLVMLFSSSLAVKAATLYFDQNGSTSGFGMVSGGSYNWNTTDSVWNTASSGGAGAFSAWTGGGDIAVLPSSQAAGGYLVNLQNNVSVAGISELTLPSGTTISSGNGLTIQAASEKVITFSPGAVVTSNIGTGRFLNFGDNVNLVGDFSVAGAGNVSIHGVGAAYSGTITMGGGNLVVAANNRYSASTKLSFASTGGSVQLAASSAVTISSLSGSSGAIVGSSSTGILPNMTLSQSANTSFTGTLGQSTGVDSATAQRFNFEKTGAGSLSLTGTSDHKIIGTLLISGGSVYVQGNLSNASTSLGNIVSVGEAGNFGGVTTSSKNVILQGASSRLTPGMENQAGVMVLAKGLSATAGGTFDFKMNGQDITSSPLNSRIVVTLGSLSLSGTLTANFIDLGLSANVDAGIAYTIFTSSGIDATLSNWVVGALPAGWTVGSNPFSVNGNDLQITFQTVAVPEPSAILLVVSAAFVGVLLSRRARTGCLSKRLRSTR